MSRLWIVILVGVVAYGLAAWAHAADTDNSPTPEQYQQYAEAHTGDAARGRTLFFSERLPCTMCHNIGQPGEVGPNLAGVGLRRNREQLIAKLLHPSGDVTSGYRRVRIALKNGRLVNGLLRAETPTAIQVRSDDGTTWIPRSDVATVVQLPGTPMPDDVYDGLSTREFADLIAFLSSQRS